MGGGLAVPRDRDPVLAPAWTLLAWPLVPTGGDALRGLKSSLVIGQKAQIGLNPFTPGLSIVS